MASQAQDIVGHRAAERTVSYSVSPTTTFHSPPHFSGGARAKQLKPFDSKDFKVLLLENVNQTGRDILKEQGYQVEALKSSLPEDELIQNCLFFFFVAVFV